MRLLRNRFIHRSVAIVLLLVFVQSILSPYYAMALTGGAHQAEFTSYEDGSSTDMVNLLTGDFSFNVPILEVPGPEGNFSLPLSYHAGISPEQEASWVGLGFNINAGSIVREINQYPDDAAGEPNYVTVQDLTGVSGWNRIFSHPFKDDWNSQTGYHGNVNLLDIIEVDFGDQGTNVGIIGVHVGDDGITFDPVQFTMAVITIVSWGIGGAASSAVSIAKSAAIDLAISTAVSFAMPVNTPGAPSAGYYKYKKKESKAQWTHHNKLALLTGGPFFSRKKSWKIFLDETRTEDMYGTLYLGKPELSSDYSAGSVVNSNGSTEELLVFEGGYNNTAKRGSASDINFNLADGAEYQDQHIATVLATDSYNVNASGISGSISPYRLEIGSVSMPRKMTTGHIRYAPVPFLNNYKVPFIYEGSLANGYIHHAGGAVSVSPAFYYGMNMYSTIEFSGFIGQFKANVNLDDVIFNERINSNLDAIKKIPQANSIEWVTNGELRASLPTSQICPNGFLDFLSGEGKNGGGYETSDRHLFRSNYTTLGSTPFPATYTSYSANFNGQIPVSSQSVRDQLSLLTVTDQIRVTIWDVSSSLNTEFSTTISSKDGSGISIPYRSELTSFYGKSVNISFTYSVTPQPGNPQWQDGIGGYSITSPVGVTYHFALPVYEYERRSESIQIADNNKRSIIKRNPPYAVTWLLTAITGPDFVDRNSNGLADDGDWGYWVKMNYGKHADAYDWRIPYSGEMVDVGGTYKSYEQGKKQLYYLNTIETRSHVALFIKSEREDGKSASQAVVPLKLDEICLLKKEHYKKLKPSFGTPDYSNQIALTCKTSQFSGTSIRDFINKNCIKRVVFNYDHLLCKGTPNAIGPNNPQQAKLTLIGITVKGRNDIKTIPDYKFEYASNPNYNVNFWDGWGYFSNSGGTSPASHKTSDPTGSIGAAWSLSKIVTPIGSEILVNYERDTYSSISGEKVLDVAKSYSKSNYDIVNTPGSPFSTIELASTTGYTVNDKVQVSGTVSYKCPTSSTFVTKSYGGEYTIAAVTSTSITLSSDYLGIGNCGGAGYGSLVHFDYNYGSVSKILPNKAGGNLRVGSIVMRDEFGKENKLRYLYANDDGSSSGAVAQEPDYIRIRSFPFYDYLKYPQTPVVYGKVSVLSGRLSTDADYNSKQVFEFEIPHKSMLTFSTEDNGASNGYYYTRKDLHKIEDRTTRIGALKSIRIYDKTSLISESLMVYTDKIINAGTDNYQGVFTEGTILTDHSGITNNNNRTTVFTYPNTLKKVIKSKAGFLSTTENLNWDLITGSVTETLTKSSLGIYIKTITTPAYALKDTNGQAVYSEMGSKAYNINNRNMLLQSGTTYTYRSDAMGTALGLISGEAQTWRKDWDKYRIYDATSGTYKDEGAQTNQIWRKGKAYAWKGAYSNFQPQYGTQSLAPSEQYIFGGANLYWQNLGEILRFDHYGMPLESVDMNGIYTSAKMGYDDRTIIASATNASYNEIAFSSAEDKIAALPFFGGEVGLGAATNTVVSSPVHTGASALSVLQNNYGFVFKSKDISTTKTYKASVWANSPNARLYYKLGPLGSEVVPSTQTISSAIAVPGMGNWYKIDMILSEPASTQIEVGAKAIGGTVVFDDFRFQPADAVMTCYVYPPLNSEFTISFPTYSPAYAYSLDNDNWFTKHEVNEKGELVKVYAESSYGVKLISETKSNLRRFNINQ